MISQYTCYARDLDNRPFAEEDKQRVDMATGSLTQIPSLRAIGPSVTTDNGPLVYTHLLPRDSSEELLSRLEYSWSMPWGTLNVDASSNIMCLSPEMRALFDQGLWIITPEKRILDIYLQNPQATINEPFYNYNDCLSNPRSQPNA